MRVTRLQVEELWFTEKTNAELQEELGLSTWELWMVKKHYRLPRRPTNRKTDDPDEATIAARCLEVQERWSEEERARRMVGGRGVTRIHRFSLAGR